MFKKTLALLALCVSAASFASVDINTATETGLDSIKGLGPGTTKRILAERANGQFKNWADLMSRVKGIKAAKAEKLSQAGLTVSGASYKDTFTAQVPKTKSSKTHKKAKPAQSVITNP